MQILAWPEVQEASALPCDTGSGLDTIRSEFKDLPVDLDLVQPGWHVKVRTLLYATNAVLSAWSALIVTQEGRWGPSARTLLERAQVARGWLMKRPEREIVVVSHGCFLHFLTDDWVNSINPQGAWFGPLRIAPPSSILRNTKAVIKRLDADPFFLATKQQAGATVSFAPSPLRTSRAGHSFFVRQRNPGKVEDWKHWPLAMRSNWVYAGRH